ncbi:MAG TPA: hypothetical protein VE993_10355 [Stellaceae bacterium]|nr:hypothetical protein [Stellaceae bacterium]
MPAAGDAADTTVPAAGERPPPALRAKRPRARRRRGAARPPIAAAAAPASETSSPEEPAPETPIGQPRRRRIRRDPAPAEGVAPAPERRSRERGERERPRGRNRRDARDRPRREGGGRQRPEPERKLYALESVVDRGFEDVEEEGETRRVPWTIVKRAVADQKSGRQMSAVYVLQRAGVDQEFPNLGAARTAANKTIVHPEKLTRSKAEHAAARGADGGKKGR